MRGMPLKEMHFRPTSRWSSAVATGERVGPACFWARDQRRSIALGAFMVIAVAVEKASQAGGETPWSLASVARRVIVGVRVCELMTV